MVLTFVFGSLMALVPLLMAAIAIPTTFLVLWPLAEATDVSIVVQFLIALIGLGVAIDYALLIVMRWREEHAGGRDNRDSVIESMEHAGKAVIISGIAVAIGLLALAVLPIPFLRSMGFAGMLIPLISVLVGITLLPVILDSIGPRLDRIGFSRRIASTGQGWVPWGRLVVRRRWVIGGLALVILALFLIPVTDFSTGNPQRRLTGVERAGPRGPRRPHGVGPGRRCDQPLRRRGGGRRPHGDRAGAGARWRAWPARWRPTTTSGAGATRRSSTSSPSEPDSPSTVERVREAAGSQPGEILVGGLDPGTSDFNDAVYGNFIYVALVIIAITFLLLARVFRSLLLPLKAILFNIISIGAVWGFMVWFWQKGNGSEAIFDIEPTGALTVWIPLMVFAFLYGLSMDYEIFILSRMREEYDRDGSTERAVVAGIARTGTPGDGGLADPVPGLPRPRGEPGDRHQGVRDRRSRSASCSTRRSCAACCCRPSWRCSAGGTGGCRSGPRGSCGSSPAIPLPSTAATCRWSWSPRPGHPVRPSPRAGPRSFARRRPRLKGAASGGDAPEGEVKGAGSGCFPDVGPPGSGEARP